LQLWRISNYADLSGRGGQLAEGRWHSKGRPILYCAESPAGALVEYLVHLPKELAPSHIQLIELNALSRMKQIGVEKASLPPGWIGNELHTRGVGDKWLAEGAVSLLRVPSVILPDTWNVLVNPLLPETLACLTIVRAQHVPLDQRLT
jgi:RES domain-containing protein